MRRISLVQARVLAKSGNGCEAVSTAHCRFKSTKKRGKATVLPIKIEKPKQSEKFLQKRPIHSIYMTKDYPQQYFLFEDCVNMQKEAAQPWMLDSIQNLLYAKFDLDLTTKKATKFMGDVRGVIVLPNKFDWGHEMNICVIAEEEEDQQKAQELGASTVGGENFPKQVAQGLFDREDIRDTDFFLCTRKMAHSMNTVRTKLQAKTPSPKNNTVSSDVVELLKHYLEGIMYESKKVSQSQAVVRVPIGRLTMDAKELEENFRTIYLHLGKMKPLTLTPHVESVRLVSPPCEEEFYVDLDGYYTQLSEKPDKKQPEADEEEEAET